jgi:hypothetical protein
MTTAPFTQPGTAEWFKPADVPGHLILITHVQEIGIRFDTLSNRDKPHGVFDYTDLDEDGQPEHYQVNDSHPGIVNKLGQAQRSGGMVLGRITQAPSSQGQPAWVLGPYAEGSDDLRATAWLTAHPRKTVQQPEQRPQAPATPAAPAASAAPAVSGSTVTVTPEIAALLAQIQQAQQQ